MPCLRPKVIGWANAALKRGPELFPFLLLIVLNRLVAGLLLSGAALAFLLLHPKQRLAPADEILNVGALLRTAPFGLKVLVPVLAFLAFPLLALGGLSGPKLLHFDPLTVLERAHLGALRTMKLACERIGLLSRERRAR
jgi:hypothetical protein